MIQYNPKDWFTFIFRIHKADTFRKLLPLILTICVYSAFVAWLETSWLNLSPDSRVKNLSLIHTTLGLVISLLLVFRTNTAYERWWEGRKLWGSLVNSSRNLAIKLNSLLDKDDQHRGYFRQVIPDYAYALKNHLRDVHIPEELSLHALFDSAALEEKIHKPNQIAADLALKVGALERIGKLKPEHLLYLQPEIANFTDVCGACERIRKTPIPFSYSVFLKKFIFIYVMTLPFGYVFLLGYLVIPVVGLIFYVLASLELIAEEIEDPFGTDANDLPTDQIAGVIRESIRGII